MARKLEDIFNECYERMRSGESLMSCLARYPEHRAELEPMLLTAFDIGRRASYIHPRPEFKHWAQVRLQGAQYHARQQRQTVTPSRSSSWRQSWAVAAIAAIILLVTTGSTVAASSDAMPDQVLYPIKLATEEVRLALAVTDTQKAQIHTQLAETRAVEVEVMASQGKTEHAAITAARLAKQLELANSAIANLESTTGTTPTTTATPEPTITEPSPPTPPEEVPAVQPPTTEEQPTTTTEQPPTTTEQPTTTTTEQPPTTTTEQPTTTTTTTKQDKRAAQRENLKKSLEQSTSKSLTALENAKENASKQNKSDWQKAIDKITDKSKEKQDTRDWNYYKDKGRDKNNSQSDNTTGSGATPTNVSPSQSQPSPPKWQRH